MKNVMLVGFTGRTSFSTAKVLLKLGARIFVSDIEDNEEKRALLKELSQIGETVSLLGKQSPDILNTADFDLILPSPGVPLSIPLLNEARNRHIEIIGDIELFYRLNPDNTYIAITGTDGKTTTTALTYEIIKSEMKCVVAGNIGTPVFELFGKIDNETVIILEMSSFQLEEIEGFHPKISAILNIADDHLDRYDSMDSYIDAKKRIAMNQTGDDIIILNKDSIYYNRLKENLSPSIGTFSLTDNTADIYYDTKGIVYDNTRLIEREDIKLTGIHNIENVMASLLIAKKIGISDKSIIKTIREFKGLPHRLEFVEEINGVKVYNDSKATTVNSIEKALMSFDGNIILIAGGRDKGLNFALLKELIEKRVKTLILIGEAANKIDSQLRFPETRFASNLESAFEEAMAISDKGDIILLSPGCTSYDMFKNYEERGETFKAIVRAYGK
jgi:UDP-N-acetylmuramoylalanine--D-glutamate ligase